jgi:hypothetical protein
VAALELALSSDSSETQRFELRAAGRYLVRQGTRIGIAGVARDETFDATPPPLDLPADLAPGRHFAARFHLGRLDVASDARVLRRERLTIGGEPVECLVIERRTTTTGAVSGSERALRWYAPSLGVDARIELERRLEGPFSYALRLRAELRDTQPAR